MSIYVAPQLSVKNYLFPSKYKTCVALLSISGILATEHRDKAEHA